MKNNAESCEKIKLSIQQLDSEINRLNEELMGIKLQWAKQESALKEICSVAEK